MADFYNPNPDIQRPDFLAAAVRGAMAPGMIQGQQQQLALGSQQIQGGQLNLDMLRQMMAYRSQALQQDMQSGAQPTQTGQSPGGASAGIENGPQGSVSSQPAQSPLDVIGNPNRISRDYQMDRIGAIMQGKSLLEIDKNYMGAQEAAITDAQQRTKIALTPQTDALKVFANDPNANRTMMANAAAGNLAPLQGYQKIAASIGEDPLNPTALGVRRAAVAAHNGLAQQSMGTIAPLEMPNPLQTTQRGGGESIQTDLLTNKTTAGAPALATGKFVQNGQVVEMPTAQAMSKGLQPYDSALFAADQITPTALSQAYGQYKATGEMPPMAGRDPIAIAKTYNYIADQTKADGGSGQAAAAQKQAYAAQGDVVKDYSDPSGKAGGKLQAINTITEHAKALNPLIDAMGTGDTQLINKAKIAYQQQTGNPAPTNYSAMANIFSGELKQAVTANGGDQGEREAIAAPFSDINSPLALKGAIQISATAMAGKTVALKKGWDVATQGNQGPFDKFLTPATKEFLGGESAASHPKAIMDILSKYPPK